MAIEYSMYPQELYVPAADAREIDASSSTTSIYFMPLNKLEDVANIFGEDFYAEMCSPREGITQHFRNVAAGDRTMKADATFPALRCTRYPDLAFIVIGSNAYLQQPTFEVLNLATGTDVYWNGIAMVNLNYPYFDIYNFNSKLQAFTGCWNKGFAYGSVIIFGDDHVLMLDNFTVNNNPNNYRIIRADSSTSAVYVPTNNTGLLNMAKTSLDPVFDPENPDRVFTGIYTFLRGLDLVFRRETHDGKMYIFFGNDGTSWSNVWRPHFVISSDVLS